MDKTRSIFKIFKAQETVEGAGVNLKRAFGNNNVPLLDPFLLLDDFHSNNPADYVAGFPWHPHRGIETVTYVIDGKVEHEDSLGNHGVIESTNLQWMTAGSGIIHSEMPKVRDGTMWGLQLWLNLPRKSKMMEPRYRDIKSNIIPILKIDSVEIKVVAGQMADTKGPVDNIAVDPEYLDILMPKNASFEHHVKRGYTVLAYILDGEGYFTPDSNQLIKSENLVLFSDGDKIKIRTNDSSLRFLLMSGKPLNEPVAWYGPIVMNSREELVTAFREYQTGSFIKHKIE